MPVLPFSPARRWRRALLWGVLVALLVVAQTLLVVMTLRYQEQHAQEQVELVASVAASEIRRDVSRAMQGLQALLWSSPASERWMADALTLLREQREMVRIERRDALLAVQDVLDSPYRPPLFSVIERRQLEADTQAACAAAERAATPSFSRSYFVPQPGGLGFEVVDVCLPVPAEPGGFLVASFALHALLESALPAEQARAHELTFIEGDGTRLARAGMTRGAGIFRATRVIDLPGFTLQLRADSVEAGPSLIPSLTTALVLGLSIALFGVVVLLLRDVRRRASAEAALAESLAFRKAMEDSLTTGLRARDLEGHITYVNPAFCAMVGFSAEELLAAERPPYWPPEHADEYWRRQQRRLSGTTSPAESREGYETVFMRKNGERFPVMIYEAPLVDGSGRHTGWMSTVVDLSAQRRVEELSRQQQERLQATARLATVGEMASLLSHELNQPLSAIASYATASLNLMEQPDRSTPELLRQAVARIAEQAERAGRVIKSVHDFVRRREQQREALSAAQLIDSVLPLVRLQARKSAARIEIDVPGPAPRVMADRTMVEQVLLNLTRNAVQAMEAMPLASRVLTLRVRQHHERWVTFSVIDQGPGITDETAQRLFTPFFTTRPEGMGLGLSLCRTVVEQHGGALEFDTRTAPPTGTEFRFTLPAA